MRGARTKGTVNLELMIKNNNRISQDFKAEGNSVLLSLKFLIQTSRGTHTA